MLERARAIAQNHDDLSEQLSDQYNADLAKKVGELSNTANILKEWEKARSVSLKGSITVTIDLIAL